MLTVRCRDPKALAARMMKRLEVIHYAVSLGHHRSPVYLMQSDDLLNSSYRLEGSELDKYRAAADDGLLRFSIGLEDSADLVADLERVLA